jgi:hypothetical protein
VWSTTQGHRLRKIQDHEFDASYKVLNPQIHHLKNTKIAKTQILKTSIHMKRNKEG